MLRYRVEDSRVTTEPADHRKGVRHVFNQDFLGPWIEWVKLNP
jgi:hypothetical protein